MPRIDVSFNGHLANCVCNRCGLARLGAESITKHHKKNYEEINKRRNR